MDATMGDDNFFIEDPQKLKNDFFTKDGSLYYDLMCQKSHITKYQFNPTLSSLMKKSKTNQTDHTGQPLDLLDFRDEKKIDRLSTEMNDLVKFLKMDDVTIDKLSAYINKNCELVKEIENTKNILRPIVDYLQQQQQQETRTPKSTSASTPQRIYHTVDYIKF